MSDCIMGIDWGIGSDSTEIAVIDSETKQVENYQIAKTNSANDVLLLVRRAYGVYEPRQIWAEHNGSGQILIEQLWSTDLPVRPFVTTAKSKTEIVARLKQAIESGTLSLNNSSPNALFTLDHESMALALAWHGLSNSSMQVDFA